MDWSCNALAPDDQSKNVQWDNDAKIITGADKDDIYAGQYNTKHIIANQGVGMYAAQICANYRGGGFADWYLPSKFELALLYLQKEANVVGNFASYYWSSTESDSKKAWTISFDRGYQSKWGKDCTLRVRAIRAF